MRKSVLIAALAMLFAAAAGAQSPGDELCASCHETNATVSKSVHAAVGCSTCHVKHEEYPHPAVEKPKCSQCHERIAAEHAISVHGQAIKRGDAGAPDCTVCHGSAHEAQKATSAEFRKNVISTCGMCHADVAEKFSASVHGKAALAGTAAAPVCTSCHGEHSILSPKSAASTVNASHIRDTCGQCHGNVRLSRRFGLPADRVMSFDASFHGLASKSGSQSVANCASCHGFHDILPSKDPQSKTNAANLPATCGTCHPGAGQRFALGPIHQAEGAATEHASVRWVRIGYSILIPLLVGYMLLHNAGDFIRKLAARRFGPPKRPVAHAGPKAVRMYGFERIEHALMASSFLTLVWTGFALKYPGQWWAWPLVAWEQHFPVRGTVHRAAAVVFLVVAVMHIVSLVTSRRLRDHWKELWPARRDIGDAVLNFLYNLGLVRHKPRIASHSYIEKIEYWAVIWGGVVMALTGFVLWFNNWSLAWLPLWVIEASTAVHFYEAVLATAAIVVWHFYGVIFDPDVYPLETAFITGVSVKQHEGEHAHAPAESAVAVTDAAEPGVGEGH